MNHLELMACRLLGFATPFDAWKSEPNIFSQMVVQNGDLLWYKVKIHQKKLIQVYL